MLWYTLSMRDGVHFTSDRLRDSEANVLSAHVYRYSPEQSMCSVRQSLLRVALGLAMNSLLCTSVTCSLSSSIISTTLLTWWKQLLIWFSRPSSSSYLCGFIDTELLVLILQKHGCYIVIWVGHNMDHMNWHLYCIL